MILEHSPNRYSLISLLTAIALITLPHAWNVPPQTFIFFSLILAWRSLGIWQEACLPNRIVVYLLIAVGALVLFSQHQGLFGRDAGTAFFLVALALKLFEINSKRDVYLVVLLAFIVAASQFLYLQSILMAGYILLVCVLLLATQILQVCLQPQIMPALKTAATIIAQALPLAIVIFVLFPRIESPRWRWLEDDNKAKSGLSNVLEPGSISDLSLSDELVFRVRFAGDLPPPPLRYWRGPVYSQTDGIRWTAADKAYHEPVVPTFTGKAYQYTLLMEPQKQNWVFALDIAEQFDPVLKRNALYQLITSKKPGDRAEYKIISYPVYNTGGIHQDEYRDNLQLPAPPSPKLVELVRQLQGFDAGPERYIENILQHFRQENFYYTLTPPLMPDNPIETFLLETRSGFCSHYATAFVYLLRIANIPARVVGGYQGGEFNNIGGFLEIKQADAHAWAEVWLENEGWVRFDPTAAIAPERIERGVNVALQIASGAVSFSSSADSAALSWLMRGRQLWQSVDYNWQRWVINYNTRNQMQFLSKFGIDSAIAIGQWLTVSVILISSMLTVLLLKRKPGETDQALRVYRKFCQKLAKAGIVIETGEGASAFAERAKRLRPELASQIEQITAIFIRLRYESKAEAGDLQALKTLVGEIHL